MGRFGRGFKAFGMRFSRRPAYLSLLPRTKFNFGKEVGDGTRSSVVTAPLFWIARTFPEARLQVRRVLADGQTEPVLRHDLVQLLRRPNPFFSGTVLWMATSISYWASGNAYWLKVRDRQRRVVQLWWVPEWMIKPVWPDDGTAFISHYEYRPDPGMDPVEVPVSDVVHFRFGINPDNVRVGLSPLASVLREVFTDDEAANFTASILRNMGVPGLLIAPEGDSSPSEDDVKEVKSRFKGLFIGDRRGEPLVMSGPTKISQFGFSPEQMNVRDLRRIPEERVSAALGVPAVVAGLGAGLDRSTFTNMAEAREMAYESNIIPAQRVIAEELEHQLLPDFERDPEAFEMCFDLTNVRVLQEDRLKLAGRLNTMVNGGWAQVAEVRREYGLPVDDSHKVYLRPVNLVEVPAEGAPPADGQKDRLVRAIASVRREAAAFEELLAGTAGTNGNGHQD